MAAADGGWNVGTLDVDACLAAPNLLVAGKCMAESFRANANTRLHPSEWTTGVAAGGAAVLMVCETHLLFCLEQGSSKF